MCAQAVHALSPRHDGPFIPVECGAIPENLVENELFGHIRGAFTDAHTDQKGLAAMADGGTLFLDEIDSLPIGAQAKLLRFIQEGMYRPLGSQKFVRADIRLVAASNRDLESCVSKGLFRADLYFRLNVLPLRLPALRDRRGDIAVLASYFLREFARAEGQAAKKLLPAALRLLQSHEWPGNVRELHNIMRRAFTFSSTASISPAQLGMGPPSPDNQPGGNAEFHLARSRVIENFEKHYLEEMLRKSGGNVTQAAIAAGKDRRVFGRLMKKYEIDHRTFK
jgi:DNA-binding NtrC family response regulator